MTAVPDVDTVALGDRIRRIDDDVAELVVIFPTNVWEYDVLDYFPFADRQSEAEDLPSDSTE